MGKIAFVFSGQGAQYLGMGEELAKVSPAAKAVFDIAESIRPGTKEQCFHGDEEILFETNNTQPCMFAMELACAKALEEQGIRADVAAGFSLGEFTALCEAEVAEPGEMFRLICRRGELMQQAAKEHPASMAAVVKLSAETVVELCQDIPDLYPVNFNCPGQVSVSGEPERIAQLKERVREAGGRLIPLKVKGGFHSPFLANAGAAFEKELRQAKLNQTAIPVYANVDGAVYGENIADKLSQQMTSPVQWEQTIRNMIADGVNVFVELGPGETLCGMIQRIDPNVTVCHVSDEKTLAETIVCCQKARP